MIKNAENKALKMGKEKNPEQEYFFPDINGKSITVKATSHEEARKKANDLTK
jgi:hypothetical protein